MTAAREPDPWPVIEWLRENFPRALELCPYKVGGESVSREARAVEQRTADASAAPVPASPPVAANVPLRRPVEEVASELGALIAPLGVTEMVAVRVADLGVLLRALKEVKP